MPAQFWEAVLNSPNNGAGTAYVSSNTIADVSAAPQLVLPANFMYPGQSFRLTAFGVLSNTASGTIVLGFYYGGVAGALPLAASAATAPGAAVTNVPWRLEATATVRTVGATGTIITQGFLDLGSSVSAVAHLPIPATALATVTIDTTSAKALTVGATWSANSASNTLTCHQFLVEAMN